MKQLKFLILCILSYASANAQWWILEERFGDGQYWEYDAINYQDYPYTTFNRINGVSVAQQIQNIKDLIKFL